MRGRVFGAYFEKLFEGDPIALAATGVFVLFLIVIAVVAIRYKMDERREAERRKNRWTKRD
jgi:hypothetical protein